MTKNVPENADMCFVCGTKNPLGLKIEFEATEDTCVGYFKANETHVGYDNTVHGGIIFSALDDVMANVLYLNNIKAHTAQCEIRYRKALEINHEVKLVGKVTAKKRRLITLHGQAISTSTNDVIAECEAKFMTL